MRLFRNFWRRVSRAAVPNCLLTGVLLVTFPAYAGELARVPGNILVRTSGKSSPTLAYAVERMVAELRTVHGLKASGETNVADPFKTRAGDTGVVVLGCPADSSQLAKWCREHGVDPAVIATQPDGYRIVAQAKPLRVVIMADTDLGAWYGACAWLDSLQNTKPGTVMAPLGESHDAPALGLRFTRGLGANNNSSRVEDALPALDWWARWRMNVTLINQSQYSEPNLKIFLAEAHKRGIRVVRGLGVRNLCAADDAAVARCADELREFLKLGGDGISALWDDLPHDRCSGHCDRCRDRFGTNSLPHEIVRVLEALSAVAAQAPKKPLMVWCPPHYSANRYPEMSDESFFRVIGASQKIRQHTYMYHCEFAPERTVLLDQAGITNRVWWYNGMRTVYHISHNWPEKPEWKLTIPDLKTFAASDFARFEVGWKTGLGVRTDGSLIPVPDKTWQDLRSVPQRYQGYYPCMDTHPYHAAISGLFAFGPREFDQMEADRVVFRAIFGPGSAEAARKWSDMYVQFQVRLAQTVPGPASEAQTAEVQKQMAEWRSISRELQAVAAQGRSLLAPAILESTFTRMREAESGVEKLLNRSYAARQ